MNEGAPADIFALSSYIARDQYGSTPLFYGATPYSKPMYEETWAPGNNLPEYSLYHLKKEKAKYVPVLSGAKLSYRSRMLSEKDSARNSAIVKSGEGYILSDYSFSRVTTPELDMFFPRIIGTSQSDIESYESWVGMSNESMDRIEISEAIDTLGNPVGKLSPSGNREKSFSYRPTYLQNLRFFLSYQVDICISVIFSGILWEDKTISPPPEKSTMAISSQVSLSSTTRCSETRILCRRMPRHTITVIMSITVYHLYLELSA